MSHWNHRIVRTDVDHDGTELYTLAEVHYDDEGKPYGWTSGAADDIPLDAMNDLVVRFGLALNKPTLLHPVDFEDGQP